MKEWLENKTKKVFDNWYLTLIVLGTALLTIAGAFGYDIEGSKKLWYEESYLSAIFFNKSVYLILGCILLFIGTKGFNKEIKDLEEKNLEIERLNKELNDFKIRLNSSEEDIDELHSRILQKHQELVKTWLKSISAELKLSVDERLTIYYESNKEFTLLARFSQNKRYDEVHKQKFPLEKGVISETWERNECIEINSPKFNANQKDYYNYMTKKYDFSIDEVESITMKSDRFYGIAIQEADENIGVLLYERVSVETEEDFESNYNKIKEHYNKYSDYFRKFIEDGKSLDRTNTITKNENSIKNDEAELMQKMGGK